MNCGWSARIPSTGVPLATGVLDLSDVDGQTWVNPAPKSGPAVAPDVMGRLAVLFGETIQGLLPEEVITCSEIVLLTDAVSDMLPVEMALVGDSSGYRRVFRDIPLSRTHGLAGMRPDTSGLGRRRLLSVVPAPADPSRDGALPSSHEESRHVMRAWRGPASAMREEQASHRDFFRGVARADVVHFAGHGGIHATDWRFSGLELRDRMPVFAADLVGSHLFRGVHLVVLSACVGAMPSQLHGPIPLSVGAMLMLAGAERVVAFRERIDDAQAAEVVTRLLDDVTDGVPSSTAAARRLDEVDVAERWPADKMAQAAAHLVHWG